MKRLPFGLQSPAVEMPTQDAQRRTSIIAATRSRPVGVSGLIIRPHGFL
jgi:hypothetical protein